MGIICSPVGIGLADPPKSGGECPPCPHGFYGPLASNGDLDTRHVMQPAFPKTGLWAKEFRQIFRYDQNMGEDQGVYKKESLSNSYFCENGLFGQARGL